MINRVGISVPHILERNHFPSDGWCPLISPQVLLVDLAVGTPPMKIPVGGGLSTWLHSHHHYQQ